MIRKFFGLIRKFFPPQTPGVLNDYNEMPYYLDEDDTSYIKTYLHYCDMGEYRAAEDFLYFIPKNKMKNIEPVIKFMKSNYKNNKHSNQYKDDYLGTPYKNQIKDHNQVKTAEIEGNISNREDSYGD